ncbi:MAG TPA: Ig-like domain-containing protein [Candidatus Dormibacteraeota bacterium]|jgi:dipeptidyl aminopeptidase/acylaminoacyl peptidase
MNLGAMGALASLVLVAISACGGNPPQIVDYSPLRGSIDVSTAAPIRITFDHDVDQQSIESRLHLQPATSGNLVWINRRQLAFQHATLAPSSTYDVVLEAGYKDPAGNTAVLRHHWSFVTEGPPDFSGSAPANGESGVDPAAYLTLDFTRDMNAASLQQAITISPPAPFSVRLDPADGRRAIVAPATLLRPSTAYTIAVTGTALDADGNRLSRDETIAFTTGLTRQLHGWVTFATTNPDGTSGALWMVNESGFPRKLYDGGAVRSFSWSPEGDSLLVQNDGGTWSVVTPGEDPKPLGFKAAWAAALASGMGYVFIDDGGVLHRLSSNGVDTVISSAASLATVSPDGSRLAFVEVGLQSSVIWGYDVGLQARYELAVENGQISDASWAPAGNRIAYLRHDVGLTTLKVRNLSGAAGTSVVASAGEIGAPAWLPDSVHVVFAVGLQNSTGTLHKAVVVSVIAPPAVLTPALGLPADPSITVANPVPSPDGHQIAFLNGSQVWLMNADGTRPTPLTTFDSQSFPYSCRTPAWTRA